MKNRLITQMRIRAIAHDKFTVRVTYTDGNSTGHLVTGEYLRKMVDTAEISR